MKGHPKAGQPTYFVEKFVLSRMSMGMYLSEFKQYDSLISPDAKAEMPKHNTIRMGRHFKAEDELTVDMIVEKVKSLPQSVKDFFKEKDEKANHPSEQGSSKVKFGAYLCMYAADGSIVNGWLASQTDMLTEDWCILD